MEQSARVIWNRPSFGIICLCGFLVLFGLSLVSNGLAIPTWVTGLLALVAGFLMLLGI